MCGRYIFTLVKEDIEKEFKVEVPLEVNPRYNIAPGQDVPVLLDLGRERKFEVFRWGLIPSWAKDPKFGYKLINARAETLFENRIFKPLVRKKRCLILSDGFYEWKKTEEGKFPVCIRLKSRKPFGFAGIWEVWNPPGSQSSLKTCTIVTTTPNSMMEKIHHRMPVMVQKDFEALWLDPEVHEEKDLRKVLLPYPAIEMDAYPVSKSVNSPKFDLPECIEPLQL